MVTAVADDESLCVVGKGVVCVVGKGTDGYLLVPPIGAVPWLLTGSRIDRFYNWK